MERLPMTDLRAHSELNAFYIIPANTKQSLLNLFSTHPPVEQRIAQLSRLEAQLQAAR
jgi:heat shock protein HtpX